MRIKSYKIFLFVFVIYLSKINICTGQNQKMFEMAYPKSEIISINEQYSKSIIINPFKQKESIFSLSINAKVILNSNKSLIRVIFIGENGDEYLVLESNYMISEQNQIEYSDYGEETAMLNGVVPGRINIEIEDASILLETFSYNNATQNKLGSKDFTFRSKKIKNNQDIVKIDILNKQIKKKGYLWKAGETPVSLMTYQQKKQLFGGTLPNLKGFDYYKGGIFNFTDTKNSKKGSASNIVSSFDWRNRHGQNWITSIKDQGSEGSCWAFGAMASLEAIINLYYNQHINKDLSEQSLVSCMFGIYRSRAFEGWPTPPLPQCAIFSPTDVFCQVKYLGAIDEDCYPYSNVYDIYGLDNNNQACTTLPPNGCNICGNLCPDYLQRLWKVTDYKELDPQMYFYPSNSWCELITEDSLKVNIIRNGPSAFSYLNWSHVMCFVGFSVIKQGDMLDNYGLVPANDPLIGQVYWIAKNSWGAGWGENGYGNFFFDLDQDVLASVVKTPITQPAVTNYNVDCTDSDGDGYCWWGIGKRPSNGCPVTSHLEEDGDDSNPLLGPYDANFNCIIISDCPSVPLIGTITHPTCTEATGSVVLNSLPVSGTWILTRNPSGITSSGSGSSTTISGLPMGTYTFTVTNGSGCTSDTSANVVINAQPIIPDISTSAAMGASISTALGGGNVTSDGGSAITECGVCWSTTINPTILNSKTSDGRSIGSFTSTITDLTNGVTYHIRAYATNCIGTGYGSDMSYTHNGCQSVPQVGTIIQPNCTEATGSVVLNSLPVSGTWILTKNPSGITSSGSGASTTISGLPMGTYTFTVTNASGCNSDTSANVVINAQPIIPDISTSAAMGASISTALGGGNVTSDGGSAITECGVCWSTTINPTILNSKTSDGRSIGSFTSTITDLTNGVTYHIRAYATNCIGTGYGSDMSYTHNGCQSVPQVGTIIQPNCTEATGSVVLNSLPVSGTWILTKNPSGITSSGSGASTTISGLPMGTYTFTVTNASGCNSDTSANVVINAQPIIPTIGTSSIIDASLSTALGGGNVTSDGGSAITECGVCWSTTINPTVLNSKTSDGRSIGSFTSTITDLTNGVTYHIRAYATNCTGTGYGSDIPYTHSPTGIENIQTTEISVFPNPITDILYIEYKNDNYETINIFNSKGVLLAKEKVISPMQQFDFSKYEYGLYILEFLKHSGETTRIKVIKT